MHYATLFLLALGLAALGVLPLLFGRQWKLAACAFGVYILLGTPFMLSNDHTWIQSITAMVVIWPLLSLIISMFSLDDYAEDWMRRPLIWVTPLLVGYVWFVSSGFAPNPESASNGMCKTEITIAVENL